MLPFLLLVCGNVLCAAGLVAHAFLFNFYLRELGLSSAVMGHQVAAMTVGGLCSLLPTGFAIDRIGLRATLLTGVAVTAVGLALTALVVTPAPIYAAAVLMGFGGATCRVSWGPAVMQLSGRIPRARAFSWNTAILIGSASVWTALAGLLPEHLGHFTGLGLSGVQLSLLGGALVTLLSIACYAFIPFSKAPTTVPEPAGATLRVGASLALPRELRSIVALIGVWMLAIALLQPFFNIYFADRFALSIPTVGTLFALLSVACAVVLIGAGELARRWGPRAMLPIWFGLLPLAFLGLSATGTLSVAIALFFMQGIIAPATTPLIDQFLLERARPEQRGVVAAWRNAAAEGSGAIGASVGGLLLSATSFSSLFAVAAMIAGAAAVALGGLLRGREPLALPIGDASSA